jgi:hypothetical protein
MAFRFVDEEEEDGAQEQSPNFQFVDEEQPKKLKRFETPQISPEQYKNMSLSEQIQYANALEREQRYERSKPLGKGIASGLTFGATENIEALKPQEGEDPLAAGFGEALGASLPIGLISKGVGLGLKGAQQAVQNGPKILQYLNRFAHGFGTGAIYESGKQGVNAAAGNEVNLSHIPVTGALFGTGEVALQGLGDLWGKFGKLSPKHQAQILEEGIIPSDLPKSQYETAEKMLEEIRRGGPPPPPGGGSSPPPPSPSLTNRVRPLNETQLGEGLALRPAPLPQQPELADRVGNIFSPNRFYNSTQGGHAFRNEIMTIDENVYRGVNRLYNTSRELNSQISEIHPNLVGRLQNRIAELSSIPEPSDVQRRLLRASENVLNRLATIGENGEITGYLPINNQVMIDQIQSLRQIIDYDFAHGNTKNIFRPLINELQESALNAAQNSGTPEAAHALNEARNAYRMWVEAFDNDYVRPFRDASNQDYSKLFKSALDFDESNMLRRILNTTPRGQELINASTREIVEKNLGKYFENPRAVNPREFDKAVRELEAVITPEQAQQIRTEFRNAAARPNIRAVQRHQPPIPPTPEEIIAGLYMGKKPEYIQELMTTRSGIKQLREHSKVSKQQREIFDTISKQKMRSIMREGNIEKEFTGNDLYKFLNKESNYEIFSELLGETETEALRKAAKEIGKEQVKNEVRNQKISKVANKLVAIKTLQFLLTIL